ITTVYDHGEPIDHVSLAFDQNGAWLVTFMSNHIGYLRWFDPLEGSYTTLSLGSVRTPFILMNNPQRLLGSQELLLVYVDDNNIYYRRQLERFQTHYKLTLTGMGSNSLSPVPGYTEAVWDGTTVQLPYPFD